MCSVEEIDRLILPTLKRIGCEFDATRLKDFTHEEIFEAISRCLLQVYPDFSQRSYRLPQNTGDRFRIGTAIADKIKELGFREDIGYQTILYGNDIEIRRLLIFLIERLPKETEKPADIIHTSYQRLQDLLARYLKRHMADPVWVPWFCRRYSFDWDDRFWYRCDQRAVSFHAQPLKMKAHKSIISQTKTRSDCLSSIISNNAQLRYNITEDLFVPLPKKPAIPVKPSHLIKTKPELPVKVIIPNPEREDQLVKDPNVQIDISACSETQPLGPIMNIDETNASIDSLRHDLLLVDEELAAIKNVAESSESRLKTMEMETDSRKRFVELIPNIDTNIKKLREYLSNSEARSAKLMAQWEQHRTQMEEELTVLKRDRSDKLPNEKLQEEIAIISDKIDMTKSEHIEKQMLLARLKKEAENCSAVPLSTVGRSFYTKRILEIISNVEKQKEEIDKILEDVKVTQKDINTLSGKLDRTYEAVDILIFEDAKRDELIKRAYKVFVNLHETCSETVKDIENRGQILREIRDLEDKIDLEVQNGIDKKLEMLITNLCEIREENERLLANTDQATS